MVDLLGPHQVEPANVDGHVLTTVSGATAWAEAAGGSGGTGKDRRWNVGPDEVTVDEFNDHSIDAGWTRIDSAAGPGRATWKEGGDALSVFLAGGDAAAELHAQVRPIGPALAAGDAFVTAFTLGDITGANYAFGGLLLADGTAYGAGKQIAATSHVGSNSADHYVRCFTGYNAAATNADQVPGVLRNVLYYVRLVYVGPNTWRRDISIDDIGWIPGVNVTYAVAPTHVGLLCSSWGSSTKSTISYEFVRRVAGVV